MFYCLRFRTHSKKKKERKKKKKTRAGLVGSFSCFLHTRKCDLGSQGLWLKWWLSSCLIWCLKGLAKPFVIEFDCCQRCYFPPWPKKKKKEKKREAVSNDFTFRANCGFSELGRCVSFFLFWISERQNLQRKKKKKSCTVQGKQNGNSERVHIPT